MQIAHGFLCCICYANNIFQKDRLCWGSVPDSPNILILTPGKAIDPRYSVGRNFSKRRAARERQSNLPEAVLPPASDTASNSEAGTLQGVKKNPPQESPRRFCRWRLVAVRHTGYAIWELAWFIGFSEC
jgi:hypothetical protein